MRTAQETYNFTSFQSIPNIARDLMSKNYLLRKKAREELIEIGRPSLDVLIELANSKDETVRWEALITIIQISSEDTLDILMRALEDEEFSIRWLAAEGIANLGKYAIVPMLQQLKDKPDSAFLRRGTHHVLRELRKKGIFKDNYALVETLANEFDHSNIVLKLQQTINSIRLT
jgi:HEAT repeat protein